MLSELGFDVREVFPAGSIMDATINRGNIVQNFNDMQAGLVCHVALNKVLLEQHGRKETHFSDAIDFAKQVHVLDEHQANFLRRVNTLANRAKHDVNRWGRELSST